MKKLLSTLTVLSLITTSTTSVVSCGWKSNPGGNFPDIYVVTDAGHITDKSFNQAGYEAGNAFLWDSGLGVQGRDSIRFIQPTDTTRIKRGYITAAKAGVKALILPGFMHATNLQVADAAVKYNGGSAVMIDSSASGMENVIGLLYRSDISGFYAGMESIIWWFTKNSKKLEVKDNNMNVVLGTFGGIENAMAVDPYLSGFMSSIEVFNMIQKDPQKKEMFNKSFNLDENYTYSASRTAMQKDGPGDNPGNTNWFTTSFDPGKGLNISENLIEGGANVILPVAGPQTADVISAINKDHANGSVYIVGVDTDQIEQYTGDQQQFFITSAQKDIKNSTEASILHSKYYSKHKNEIPDVKKVQDIVDNLVISTSTGEKFDKTKDNWAGEDLWFGGSVSTNPKNQASKELADKIQSWFTNEDALTPSKNFFAGAQQKGANQEYTLSNSTITKYAKDMFESMSNVTTKNNCITLETMLSDVNKNLNVSNQDEALSIVKNMMDKHHIKFTYEFNGNELTINSLDKLVIGKATFNLGGSNDGRK